MTDLNLGNNASLALPDDVPQGEAEVHEKVVKPASSIPLPGPSTASKDKNYYKRVEQVKKIVNQCIKDKSTSQHSVNKWVKDLEEALLILNSLK